MTDGMRLLAGAGSEKIAPPAGASQAARKGQHLTRLLYLEQGAINHAAPEQRQEEDAATAASLFPWERT